MESAPEIKLLPGERVLRVQELELATPERMPVALEELCKLAGVDSPAAIGTNGHCVASRASDANGGHAELHLFEHVFGRDSLLVALILAHHFPLLLEATVKHLGGHQGKRFDPFKEEEPGRIPHEIRDPDAGAIDHPHITGAWGWPYYGSVDATPLFVTAAAEAIRRRPEFAAELCHDGRTVQQALEAAIDWIMRRVNNDRLNLVSHQRANPHGLHNQVWKDSWDSMFHRDGTIANPAAPVASLEVQALAFDALWDAALLLPDREPALETATLIERSVEQHLWLEQEGFYAIGVDLDPATGRPRPLEVKASNMGWLLRSRLLERPEHDDRRKRIIELLLSDEFLADAGIRTLSNREIRFRPRAYHNGNVWGFDNYLISQGLEWWGFAEEAAMLRHRIVETCRATHRFPEYVAGGAPGEPLISDRVVDLWDEHNQYENRVEQPPQEIQAWTVASVCAIEPAAGRERGAA